MICSKLFQKVRFPRYELTKGAISFPCQLDFLRWEAAVELSSAMEEVR